MVMIPAEPSRMQDEGRKRKIEWEDAVECAGPGRV